MKKLVATFSDKDRFTQEWTMIAILASFRIALSALMVDEMTFPLTMLGIIIGVGAVVAMIAVDSGAKAQIVEHIARIDCFP